MVSREDDLFVNSDDDDTLSFAGSPSPSLQSFQARKLRSNKSPSAETSTTSSQSSFLTTSSRSRPRNEMNKIVYCTVLGVSFFILALYSLFDSESKTNKICGSLPFMISLYFLFVSFAILFDVDLIYGKKWFLRFIGLVFLSVVGTSVFLILVLLFCC